MDNTLIVVYCLHRMHMYTYNEQKRISYILYILAIGVLWRKSILKRWEYTFEIYVGNTRWKCLLEIHVGNHSHILLLMYIIHLNSNYCYYVAPDHMPKPVRFIVSSLLVLSYNDNDIENLDWELCNIKCVSLIVVTVYQMSGNL